VWCCGKVRSLPTHSIHSSLLLLFAPGY